MIVVLVRYPKLEVFFKGRLQKNLKKTGVFPEFYRNSVKSLLKNKM